MVNLMVATRNIQLPSSFISPEDIKYFREQGGFGILKKLEKTFGTPSLNYLLTHTRVLYDRRSMDTTAGGTCTQSRTMSVVRLRYKTTASKARSRWWSHVLLHELLHSLFANVSLAISTFSDEPISEGISILAENMITKGPTPNKIDMIYAMQALDALEAAAKKKDITAKQLLISLAGESHRISRSKLLAQEYRSLKYVYRDMYAKPKESIELMYRQIIRKWIGSN